MKNRRAIGVFALATAILAALSFAVVDVSIAEANGCVGSGAVCSEQALPVVAITFAALGVLSLLVCIVPAVTWFVDAIQRAGLEHELPLTADGPPVAPLAAAIAEEEE